MGGCHSTYCLPFSGWGAHRFLSGPWQMLPDSVLSLPFTRRGADETGRGQCCIVRPALTELPALLPSMGAAPMLPEPAIPSCPLRLSTAKLKGQTMPACFFLQDGQPACLYRDAFAHPRLGKVGPLLPGVGRGVLDWEN